MGLKWQRGDEGDYALLADSQVSLDTGGARRYYLNGDTDEDWAARFAGEQLHYGSLAECLQACEEAEATAIAEAEAEKPKAYDVDARIRILVVGGSTDDVLGRLREHGEYAALIVKPRELGVRPATCLPPGWKGGELIRVPCSLRTDSVGEYITAVEALGLNQPKTED